MQSMRLNRQSQQTDACDKVYGIMGLLDPSITAWIQPDYSLSILQIYTDFIEAMITATGKLDIICQSRVNLTNEKASQAGSQTGAG
jgi:hypothetical protein